MQVAVLAGSLSSSGCRSREELPYVRGQRQQWRVPGCDDVGAAERNHPASEVRGNDLEEPLLTRGQGWRPGRSTHVQGVVAALAQEGLEELSHIEGQEGWR